MMNWYKRARLELDVVEAAKRENPGPEHQRLEAVLRRIARDVGFADAFDFPGAVGGDLIPPPGPEVALQNAEGVFLGDAKDAEHETAYTEETRRRIYRYMRGLALLLHSGKAKTGAFMIATNTPDAADAWTRALGLAAAFSELRHVEGRVKAFRVDKYDDSTWLVF
jgi:hypothetical protein